MTRYDVFERKQHQRLTGKHLRHELHEMPGEQLAEFMGNPFPKSHAKKIYGFPKPRSHKR